MIVAYSVDGLIASFAELFNIHDNNKLWKNSIQVVLDSSSLYQGSVDEFDSRHDSPDNSVLGFMIKTAGRHWFLAPDTYL